MCNLSSIFMDKASKPNEAMLTKTLGKSKKWWEQLIDSIQNHFDNVNYEWKHYIGQYGWQLKVSNKKRALMYLVPHQSSFLAGMALNDTAVNMLEETNLPLDLIQKIQNSKKFPEGRGALVEVKLKRDLVIVDQLLQVKAESLQ